MQYEISHNIRFQAERDDTWPESLPWPEWKPETDKSYRPDTVIFGMSWAHGEGTPRVPHSVTVIGMRILKSGNIGSDVRCNYYGDGLKALPRVMHEIFHRALGVALFEKDSYEGHGEALATAVPIEVP